MGLTRMHSSDHGDELSVSLADDSLTSQWQLPSLMHDDVTDAPSKDDHPTAGWVHTLFLISEYCRDRLQ